MFDVEIVADGTPSDEVIPNRDIKYRAGPTAAEFHKSKALFRGLRGPIGSGKSVSCCWELFRLAMCQAPNENGQRRTRWAVIRNSYPELRSTTIKTWQDWFPQSLCPIKWEFPINGRMVLPLADGTTLDMELVFLAIDRPEDSHKLLSLELTGAWVNEARQIRWGIFEALMGRIGRYPAKRDGGHTRKCVIADTNSPDESHWWYKLAETAKPAGFDFFQQPPAVILQENGTYIINPAAENLDNLSDGARYYLDQVPGKDREWIRVYLEGNYGTVQDGKPVYGMSYNDALHCSPVPFSPVPKWPVVLTFDFGLTPAAIFMQVTPFGQLRIIDELVATDMDARQLCQLAVVPLIKTKYAGCTIFVTGDPAGTQRAQGDSTTCYDILHQELDAYVKCIEEAETNSLVKRLDAVKIFLTRLVGGRACFQLSPECTTLRRGFLGGYKYARTMVQGHEIYRDDPVKNEFSHPHDALQYGCMLISKGLPMQPRLSGGGRHLIADEVVGY